MSYVHKASLSLYTKLHHEFLALRKSFSLTQPTGSPCSRLCLSADVICFTVLGRLALAVSTLADPLSRSLLAQVFLILSPLPLGDFLKFLSFARPVHSALVNQATWRTQQQQEVSSAEEENHTRCSNGTTRKGALSNSESARKLPN